MLQITIIHMENKLTKVLEIKEIDSLNVLSQFDDTAGKINLEPLKDHIGEEALITHFNKVNDCTSFDYEHVKTITGVGVNENGIEYFSYE